MISCDSAFINIRLTFKNIIKMSKKNNNNKKPATAPASKKAPQVDPAPKVENPEVERPVVQTVATNQKGTVETIENIVAGKGAGGLSMDGQVRLLDLTRRQFIEDPNAEGKYGKTVIDTMDRVVAAGIVAVWADVSVNDNSTLAYVVKKSCYPQLMAAAKEIGVTLPDVKLLAAPVDPSTGEANENQVVVKTDQIQVSEETKKQAKEEKKIAEQGAAGKLELDPEKVAHMGEEDLNKALKFILIDNLKKNKSPKNALIETVEFMQKYRLELANQAENAGEARQKAFERSMYEILMDAFKYVKPTIHLKGIGVGMHTIMTETGSVLPAFLILRNHMTDKDKDKPDWDDQSIADATRALIEMIANDRIENAKALLEALDPKEKDAEARKASYEREIKDNENILNELSNVSFDFLDKDNEDVHKAFGRILEQYYKDVDVKERPLYENLEANLKMQGGIILNLFRAPGNKHQNYDETNLLEIKKMSLEEYEKKVAEQKKAELEAKKAAKAAEEKKDDNQESKNA